jgi:class 3 adenylate cyclase
MPCLSLRVTIGALGALSVVIVAVVTLTIALTSSLSALRSVGEKHAAALLSNADSETAALFRSGTDAIESLVNVSLSRKWNWPSDDSNVYASYDALHHSVLLRAPDLSAVTTYFADNTRIAYARKSENADWANNFVASPYSREAPNQTVLNDVRWFDVITHAPLPVTTTETILPYRVRENDLWGTFNLATFSSMFPNVYSPTVIPDFSPSGGNSPGEVSLPMIAPIYVYGATKGAANVFGYTTITMRLSRISDFLLASKSTPHSAGFVYDGINYLIGSSESVSYLTRRPLQKPVPTGCSSTEDLATALNGANITHHLMCRSSLTAYPNAALNHLANSNAAVLKPKMPTVQRLSLDGAGYYVATSKIHIQFRGLEAYLLILIPEVDIIGDVVRSRNVAIAVTAVLVVVVATLSTVVVWLLLAPLSVVATRMLKAANLEDDAAEEGVSAMAEVAELQQAYYEMNDELKRIRSFVPQSVLVARRQERDADAGSGEDEISLEGSHDSNKVSASVADDSRSTCSRRSTRHTPNGHKASDHAHGTGSASTRQVSVLAANLVGLHAASAHASVDALVAHLGEVVTVIEAAVTERHGVLTFHGDRFLATFNTARPCASHATKAATAAVALVDSVPAAGPLRLKLSCGVATGPCVVGSMGSATMKTFCTVGAAVTDAAALERLTRLYGVSALATHRTCIDASSACGVRYVDLVALRLKDRMRPVAIAEVRNLPVRRRLSGSGAEEWMYFLNNTAGEAHAPFNKCFELLQQNDCKGAAAAYDSIKLECDRMMLSTTDEQAAAALLPPARLRDIMELLLKSPTADTMALCRTSGNQGAANEV